MDEKLKAYQDEQKGEWFTYVAKHVIHIDNVRAFNEGDAVPVSHVTRGIVDREDVRHVDEAVPGAVTVYRPTLPVGTLDQPAGE
jgi:hypothetical protein